MRFFAINSLFSRFSRFFFEKLTTKRQKLKKFAIDSDSEENFSSLLAKPTKTEKESLERKDFPHTSGKKPQKSQNLKEKPQTSQETGTLVQASPQIKREERVLSALQRNGDKELAKKDENIEKNKQKPPKSQETPKKKEAVKAKPLPISKKNAQKSSNSSAKPAKTKQPDSELSLFNPTSSSEEERKPANLARNSEKNEKKREINKSVSKNSGEKLLLKPKDSLIKGILRRWWYCMEDWPPENYDYAGKLKEKGLRQVEFQKWKAEPERNELGIN